MSEKILVPTLGESVTEATVAKWLKNEGDKVMSDEPLVELETDKVNVEVPSPSNGILENITVEEGQTVNVGALLGSISKTKSGSSDATLSPLFFNHFATVASVTDSPRVGTTIFSDIN